jgi:hypothetical protein
MNKKYSYELIRDYLHGVLDKKTAEEIGMLIRTDETARSIALGIIYLEKQFKEEAEADVYLDTLYRKRAEMIAERTKASTLAFKPFIRMAAALLLLVTAGVVVRLLMAPGIATLVDRELRQPYSLPTLARTHESFTTLDSAYQLYSQADYPGAAQLFQRASQLDQHQTVALFYFGLSELYAGNCARAANLLASGDLVGTRFEQQARWYQSLALIQSGDRTKAREQLEWMAADPNHFKSKEASELLSKIK